LQSIIEEQKTTNEELRSANEEIQSSNEELQSINEEMETAKEELQSTNEELTTVNEELQNRNEELTQLNNDLNNLLSSVNIPIVMLGNDLRIRRFTPMAEKVLNLISADIGRPIMDIRTNLKTWDLKQSISKVIESLETHESQIEDNQGKWYSMRIRPYRTIDNKIDGVVIILLDLGERPRKKQS
jgi:two-component system CheB/CheR fusion protein